MSVITSNVEAVPMGELRPRGLLATLCWFVLSFLLPGFVAGGLTWYFGAPAKGSIADHGVSIALMVAQVLLLVAVVHRARWPISCYFAIATPRLWHIGIGLAALAAVIAIKTGLAQVFATGNADHAAIAAPFSAAGLNGALFFFVLWGVVIAPACEEMIFRGFLYRGICASQIGTVGAIIIVTLLFGLVHTQYTWFGILGSMMTGAVYTTLRWYSGNIAVPFVVHATNNMMALMLAASRAA